ncbi:conserved hypothetical protein [Frankia canadensis]|uniref:Uncharacterized protein n=1 Tax=Frankia canadensis TaxID=1836972 RepID=A0A2I2KNW6_9ACTN|nr:DUF190 domain-containing protein [Frankia canadensis]SNQ47361.1 conserved hypothetical protein [Frankia canadensis]SOU54651.1 conserved hypothetical protein [Frankia canadensis]
MSTADGTEGTGTLGGSRGGTDGSPAVRGAAAGGVRGERALRLTVFVGDTDLSRHRPLASEIVARAHRAGLAGASVFRGVEGFGASSRVHTERLLSASGDLPVAVVIVDDEARVRAFLPELDGLVGEGEGLAVLDEVEVVRYGTREDG